MNSPAPVPVPASAPALKEIFNAARIAHLAEETAAVFPAFSAGKFRSACMEGLEARSLMERLGHVTECLHAQLPSDYGKALGVLRELAPRINSRFVTMMLPEYVSRYGLHDFESSMDALKYFTSYGSSEFAIRHFLRNDLNRTLAVMQGWAGDEDEHVRRLASEGSRPRLPWSFHLPSLIDDPSPTAPILEQLKSDPSLYVRKSVANHLNDIGKDNPEWALDLLQRWPRDSTHTKWIVKHALRTLVKKGDRRALALIGASEGADVRIAELKVRPESIRLGDSVELSFQLASTSKEKQHLVVDYAIHYVKKSGQASAKVFKLKTLDMEAGTSVLLGRRQSIRDFTTRAHYPGRHDVEVLVNGKSLARSFFVLLEG